MTSRSEISLELYTSSYGEEGIIDVKTENIDNETALYSEFYDIPILTDILDVHIEENSTTTRTVQFSTLPFHNVKYYW